MQRQHRTGRQRIKESQLITTIARPGPSTEQQLMQKVCFAIEQPDPFNQRPCRCVVEASQSLPGAMRQPFEIVWIGATDAVQQSAAETFEATNLQTSNRQQGDLRTNPTRLQLSADAVVGHRLRWRWVRRQKTMTP